MVVELPGHEAPDERGRVADIYRRYRENPRKRRSWSAENPGNQTIRAELVRAVFTLAGTEIGNAQALLDIGCGTGWWLAELAGRTDANASLYGLELLPERIAAAAARVPSAMIMRGDARKLPFNDRQFDAVSLFTVLSSLPGRADASLALREAWRVLAPGGVLLVWEPRVPNPLNRNTLLIGDRLLRDTLGATTSHSLTTTLLPPVARRLGRHTTRLYPLLTSLNVLRTHRLTCLRAPG